jgi:hypothetical protein
MEKQFNPPEQRKYFTRGLNLCRGPHSPVAVRLAGGSELQVLTADKPDCDETGGVSEFSWIETDVLTLVVR